MEGDWQLPPIPREGTHWTMEARISDIGPHPAMDIVIAHIRPGRDLTTRTVWRRPELLTRGPQSYQEAIPALTQYLWEFGMSMRGSRWLYEDPRNLRQKYVD